MGLASTQRGDFRVTIHEADLDALAGFAAAYPRRETGGNLFGFWTHSGAPAVQLVLGPGPQARHESVSFFQDPTFMAAEGQELQRAFGLQHIGDWHSHHTLGLAQPSGGDAQTIRRTLAVHGFPRFLAVIATLQPNHGGTDAHDHDRGRGRRAPDHVVELNAYLFEADSTVMRRGSWVVLPGQSPVTEAAQHRQVGTIGWRATARWRVDREPVASPVAGWYTQRWGTEFVRTLDAQCRTVFDNCRITSGLNAGDLYYTFEHEGVPGTIGFPPTFPQDPPMILVAGSEVPLVAYDPQLSRVKLADVLVRATLASLSGSPDRTEPAEEVLCELDPRSAEEA